MKAILLITIAVSAFMRVEQRIMRLTIFNVVMMKIKNISLPVTVHVWSFLTVILMNLKYCRNQSMRMTESVNQ
ncbi:hypothetical protein BY55_01240 [Escherichia coli O169:H41 str. F9792]|nr:hypothetical protein BY55_01240 [Escherichia coli O169:H41 str. F9792]